jgi:PAS domain S-box-containing protein
LSSAAPPITILLVEDNPGDTRLLRELLADTDGFTHELVAVERLSQALEALAQRPVDVVLLDLTQPDAKGLDGLRRLHDAHPQVPVVVLTGLADEAVAVEAVKLGAQDYLGKGEAEMRLLARSIRYAVERSRSDAAARKLALEQAAHATAASERARLHSLFEQAPTGICVLVGPELRFELANPRYQQLSGRTELVGKRLLEAIPELAGQGFDERLASVLATGQPYVGREVPCRLRRGGSAELALAFFDFTYEPMRGEGGAVTSVLVMASEVTDQVVARQRVEEARRAAALSEQRFRVLAEVLPQIIWSTTATGGDVYLSPRWFEYTGQAPGAEDLETRWRAALHPDDHERYFAAWSQAGAAATLWQVEVRLRRHDGVYRWHLGRAIPHRDADGTILRWYGTATDIDEQRRAIRSRDDLLATVSHDLRGPLGVVSMAAATLAAGAPSARALAAIERAVARMTKLIQDLLDMASIESGHLSVEPAPLVVAEVIEEAVDSIQAGAAAKRLSVATELDAARLAVNGDRGRVLQVLGNILGNAVKFTPEQGRISVRARATDERAVSFAISDTGPGIDAAHLPHVFDRFWQARETARAGTGLGLAICKGIVQQHGGRIWVESQVGVGTTFYFTLPLA